ncbi:hypothetical protein [Paludisphaera mucosa]|uniref:Carboxypeptidase regulatory-like domain-containing protein n=1 Tax=Paludisphaera mucosa TaxID=3030827 RepID=A0ABT6FKV0_9BACT|nr:hypothetical protein [Paludisphaera mucosa]MDG3008211.1 hypothetical protein [Paludisphaera mucosa]
MRTNRVLLVALASAAAVGCGEGISAPRTVPTSGTVLFKGKPVGGVKVTLHPNFNMTFTPNGVTGQDGRFTLSTAAPMDGVPPGEYSVTFELLRAGADKRGLDTEFDVWKGKYANPDAAPKATVGSSDTTLEPFRLD